ncbi:FecR family protein [Ulvibacterium sp.]|uniref:FecR family protein n=1 Tax=Ulvibacterium sp. TaxID=2665914 RepID=UPI003BAA6125
MTKKEFFDLLVKFEQGQCSKREEDVLFSFYDSFQDNDVMGSWDLSEKEQARIRLLKRINKTIRNQKANKNGKATVQKWLRVAAVFIGIIGVGFMLLEISSDRTPTIVIPQDAITLEMEDGSIEVIQEDGDKRVIDSQGNVVGQQNGNELVYTETESSRELTYNTLTVPYGKTFQLHLSDGSRVHLNAGSSLKYPVQFLDGMERKVFVNGEAFLDVAKDSAHPFIVQAENLNVRVLGTRFNVHAYPEDEVAEVVLVEGAVGLHPDNEKYNEGETERLRPGYKASFNKANREIVKNEVVTSIYTSWMDGELVFRKMTFDNILKKLERHYNVSIENRNHALGEEEFSASFSDYSITQVLESLKDHYGIQYFIENNTIIIE